MKSDLGERCHKAHCLPRIYYVNLFFTLLSSCGLRQILLLKALLISIITY